jgi:hypothetical protein
VSQSLTRLVLEERTRQRICCEQTSTVLKVRPSWNMPRNTRCACLTVLTVGSNLFNPTSPRQETNIVTKQATMAAKRVSPDTVIDLTLDSDDEQDKRQVGDIRKTLYSGSRKKNKRAKMERADNADNADMQHDDVEIIDPPIKEDRKPAAACTPTMNHDGVEIVDAPTPPVAAATSARDADEDLQVVGTKNEVRLPHNRCSCTTYKYATNPSSRADLRRANEKHCDLCYCYGTLGLTQTFVPIMYLPALISLGCCSFYILVCDIPAKDCKVRHIL